MAVVRKVEVLFVRMRTQGDPKRSIHLLLYISTRHSTLNSRKSSVQKIFSSLSGTSPHNSNFCSYARVRSSPILTFPHFYQLFIFFNNSNIFTPNFFIFLLLLFTFSYLVTVQILPIFVFSLGNIFLHDLLNSNFFFF